MIVRKLNRGSEWKRFLIANPDAKALALPGDLLAEFFPSQRDEEWLSLYRVSIEEDCADVAAALSFLLRPVASSEQFFLGVSEEKFSEMGFPTRNSAGQTFHGEVDNWHCEVHLPTAQHAIDLTNCFLSGDIISAKGTQIDLRRTTAIRSGHFRIADVAQKPKQFENSCSHILVNVGSGGIVPAGPI